MAVVNDIEGLLDWGRVNGVETHPNVAVKNGPDGERGVFYVHEREQQQQQQQHDDDDDDDDDDEEEKFEVLVSVPEKALLCASRSQSKALSVELEDDSLCDALLREMKKNEAKEEEKSFWCAYVRTLPKEYDLIELWTDEEIEKLQIESAKATALELRLKVLASYERQLMKKRNENDDISFTREEWAYAKATVRSRTVSVPWSSAGALAPIGDMFNYAPVGGFFGDDDDGENDDEKAKSACVSVGTGVWNESKNAFEFRGTLPKKFSSSRDSCELFMNYGAYTNLELLSLYGFHCGQNNPNDVIALDVPMKTTKTESSYQAKVIATSGALTFESERDLRLEYAVLASFKNSNDKHAQRAHTAAQRHSFSALASRGEQLSDASEINFCTAVRDAAGRALLSFATTAKQDCDALEEHFVRSRQDDATWRRTKLAIEYRLAVKRALQKTYRLYEKRMSGDG